MYTVPHTLSALSLQRWKVHESQGNEPSESQLSAVLYSCSIQVADLHGQDKIHNALLTGKD